MFKLDLVFIFLIVLSFFSFFWSIFLFKFPIDYRELFCFIVFSTFVGFLTLKEFLIYFDALEAYWICWQAYLLEFQMQEAYSFSTAVQLAAEKSAAAAASLNNSNVIVKFIPAVTRLVTNLGPLISATALLCGTVCLTQWSFGRWLLLGALANLNGNSILSNVFNLTVKNVVENTFTTEILVEKSVEVIVAQTPLVSQQLETIPFLFTNIDVIFVQFVSIHGFPPFFEFIDFAY